MKYIFFGTPHFAEIVLGGLIDAGLIPAALVCNPDKPVGRKKIITAPLTKQLAMSRAPSIEIIQPEKFDDGFLNRMKAMEPDLFIVAAYAKIIPQEVLGIPRAGSIGVHPSLLPKYRGSSPIQSAILDGTAETGTTLYLMDDKMDHGPVLVSKKIQIDPLKTDYSALELQLAELGAKLLTAAIPRFMEKEIMPEEQDESAATFTGKFKSDDAFISEDDLSKSARDQKIAKKILLKINAFTPEPGAWSVIKGKRVKLLKAELRDGILKTTEIQEEGGRPKAA